MYFLTQYCLFSASSVKGRRQTGKPGSGRNMKFRQKNLKKRRTSAIISGP